MIPLITLGICYIALGLWCAASPDQTSSAVGFSLANASGRSEWITVYGGLQAGLGAAMLLCGYAPSLRLGGLAFAAVFSWGLVLFRTPTLLTMSVRGMTYGFAVVEVVSAAWLTYAYFAAARD
ncbi:MAG: DUF4345 domain-containing protein [Planctomycetaceae bacterium]|nr:DUF4345 domain-containing protein [Planctomycetaceae bacterium]